MTEHKPPLGHEHDMPRPVKWALGIGCVLAITLLFFAVGRIFGAEPMPHLAKPPGIDIYFSPNGGCTAAIVHEIEGAKQTILVQAYSFTSDPIEDALAAAAKRGVKVQLIEDAKVAGSEYRTAQKDGIECRKDAAHKIAHSKYMVLDGATTITGSFNFSNAAEHSNSENMLVIHDKTIAAKYSENWAEHWEHSK